MAEGAPITRENCFVTYTDWRGYLKFLAAVREQRGVRITYDRGFLEIMTPLPVHEWMATVVGALLEDLAMHLNLPLAAGGSMTFKREDLDRGLEPDKCYWLAHAEAFTKAYDPRTDPPPDLVVEVDITRRSTRRKEMYRAMGVPEMWRCTEHHGVEVFCLEAGQYEKVLASANFPQVPMSAVRQHLEMAREGRNLTPIKRAWRQYLLDHIPAR